MHDEELAARGVRRHRARHGQHAAAVLQLVFEAVGGELASDGVARSADALSLRVAALDHKAGDDAVKDHAVIKAFFAQGDEVVDRIRRDLGVELRLHDLAVFHFDGDDRIAHRFTIPFVLFVCAFHCALDVALRLPLGLAVALVVQLLALAQPQLDLHAAVLEIHPQRDQRHAVLHDARVETHDLALVHQEAPRPHRVAVEDVAVLIRGDVHAAHEQLAVLDGAEGILQIHTAGADGLDLRPAQLDPGFKTLEHEVFMKSLAVGADLLHAHELGSHRLTSLQQNTTTGRGKIKAYFMNSSPYVTST